MTIKFIRHSKTLIEPEKPIVLWGLSEVGIEKAKTLSTDPVVKDIDVMYASLQTKAIETAVYLTKPNAIQIKTDNDFTEVTSFTKKFITKDEGYDQKVHDFYHNKLERISDGESHVQALARFNAAIEKAVKDEESLGHNTIGIVSHGNILSYFTAQYADVTPYELHRKIQMPDVAIFDWNTRQFTILWNGLNK